MLALLAVALLAACSGGASEAVAPSAGEGQSDAAQSGDVSRADAAATEYDFATGPAVLIAAGYEPPKDRVDSTGAYLPVNGLPTVVFVDAIW